jgi:eukaryotic-like serine/threonine-protein kinase
MATVYLGRDVELDRPVAVKLLARELAPDVDVRARFIREARIAARLSHPNVVAVFDTGEEDGLPYIVMEHVAGETLADRVRRGRLRPDEVVEIGRQACAGLEHAHAAGLVHRDVKPANLLLRVDGTLKIADFGIARAAEASRVTAAGTVLGTAAYLAPEQAQGGDVSAAADVYSLGAVLYECLTGQPPYAFESLAELGRKQAEEPIQPVRDLAREVPGYLEAAVMQALARVPEHRPAAGALADTLVNGPSADVTRVNAAPRPPRRYESRRRRVRIAAAAVAVTVGAGVGTKAVLDARDDGGGGADGRASAPASIEPPARGTTPEETARNLADWLRENAASR